MKDKTIAQAITGWGSDKEEVKKSYLIKANGDIVGNECHNYFHGSDGEGTCNTKRQWWISDDCPMWIPQKDWDTKRDWINQ